MKLYSRRHILAAGFGAATAVSAIKSPLAAGDLADESVPHIATNTYPWLTFARRANEEFRLHTDKLLANIRNTGIVGYEPIIQEPSELDGLAERLDRHSLSMSSIYVNSVLHDPAKVESSIESVLAIAESVTRFNTKIIVTNPSPIRWGGTEDKTDQQLRLQAMSLDRLGRELRQRGLTLAYHNHDAELRQGGREFHHMLTATDPDNVKLCLDAHWIYRGCGNSEVAVFDALTHYHSRIVELHLRQSAGGVWTESFTMQGDIDYERLCGFLNSRGIKPHYVLEQAVEAESPTEKNVVDAHRQSQQNLKTGLLG